MAVEICNEWSSRCSIYYAWDLSAGWKKSSVEKLSKVIYWFEKAGYNGSDKAFANLGALYDNDERDVLKEIEELADKGDAMAQYNIGWINGRGLLTEDGLKKDENFHWKKSGYDDEKKW